MSLEDLIKALIVAVEANTAALTGGAAPAAGNTKTTPAKTTATKTKAAPKITKEEAVTALMKVNDDFGLQVAKAILADFSIPKMKEIKDDQAEAVYNAAIAKHAELTAAGEPSGDDDL